jgi:hypothetical protein
MTALGRMRILSSNGEYKPTLLEERNPHGPQDYSRISLADKAKRGIGSA